MSAYTDLKRDESAIAAVALVAASEKLKEYAPIDTGNLVHGRIKRQSKHQPNKTINELRSMVAKNGEASYDGAGFKATAGHLAKSGTTHTLEATARYAKWVVSHKGPIGYEKRGGWFKVGSKHAVRAFKKSYEPAMAKALQAYGYRRIAEELRKG